MLICEGEEIGGDLALVCLLKAGQTERSGLEESRRRVRLWRRLMGVERTAVVFGRTVLVSDIDEPMFLLEYGLRPIPAWWQLLVSSPPQSTPRYGVVIVCEVLRWRRDLE
jgi:hypothetical protein